MEVRILGPLEVWSADAEQVELRGRQRALLAAFVRIDPRTNAIVAEFDVGLYARRLAVGASCAWVGVGG